MSILAYGYSFGRVFVESISRVGMQPSEGKRKGCKESRKLCKRVLHPKGTYADVVTSVICFPFVSHRVMIENIETRMG